MGCFTVVQGIKQGCVDHFSVVCGLFPVFCQKTLFSIRSELDFSE
jgi:hypothetical protein